MSRALAGSTVACCLLLLGATARASDSFDVLVRRVRTSSDFRVRTQAALALGASKKKEAVEPLCKGLEDTSTTVRAASAAALGKLALGGKGCLVERMEDETNASVKSVIEKAIARVEGGGGLPDVSAETEYYVAIADTVDKTGRKSSDVTQIVRTALVSGAGSSTAYAFAPKKETPQQAKAVLAKFKQLKAYYLWPKVSPPDYSGGNLTIRFEISIFTYPGKALKGTVPIKLTMPDVSSSDIESENELIKMAASKAFEKFIQNVTRLE